MKTPRKGCRRTNAPADLSVTRTLTDPSPAEPAATAIILANLEIELGDMLAETRRWRAELVIRRAARAGATSASVPA